MINACFICSSLVDEQKFDSQKRDDLWFCSDECLDGYFNMEDYDVERRLRKLKESDNED